MHQNDKWFGNQVPMYGISLNLSPKYLPFEYWVAEIVGVHMNFHSVQNIGLSRLPYGFVADTMSSSTRHSGYIGVKRK